MLTIVSWSQQFPEGISYQAQIFDSNGLIISNSNVGVKFTLRASSLAGSVIWEETHILVTSDLGHVSAVIGTGTSTGIGSSLSFDQIDWATDIHFLETSVDELNNGTYVSALNHQFMAVPFAFHSKTTSQKFKLSELEDVDTTGIQIGDVLKWDGTNWVPGPDLFMTSSDSVDFANNSGHSIYSDTATYAANCIVGATADTSQFAYYADSSNYANSGYFSNYSDSSIYADTANIANFSIGNWGLMGNPNTNPSTQFLGTTDSIDLIFKAFNLEKMRIKANGQIGIGTASPLADLHISNVNGALFTGDFGQGVIPIQGAGTRMMWYPKKAAFRVGHVAGTNWDDINIGDYSFAAGYNCRASGDYSIAFGNASTATAEGAFAAGNTSISSGLYSIAMGHNPTATGDYSIALGRGAIAQNYSSIAIGYHPTSSGDYAVSLGNFCTAAGQNSVAIGFHAEALNNGSFIFNDQSDNLGYVNTTADNQFMIKASGGTIIYSSSNLGTGVELAPGAGAWSTLSDRNAKEDIIELDPQKYLELLNDLEVYRWKYKSQNDSISHIGPMAQDFYSTFNLGIDSTVINSGDFDGINLILLKALYEKVDELEMQKNETQELMAKLENLNLKREQIALMLLDLERKLDEYTTNGVKPERE